MRHRDVPNRLNNLITYRLVTGFMTSRLLLLRHNPIISSIVSSALGAMKKEVFLKVATTLVDLLFIELM